MCDICPKCGDTFTRGVTHLPYCELCKVRLGLTPYSLGKPVSPGPQDYMAKQINESILSTWVMETERKENDRSERRSRRNNRSRRDTVSRSTSDSKPRRRDYRYVPIDGGRSYVIRFI